MALRIRRSLLHLRLKQAKLTQREFAKRLGVSEAMVSKYTSGERTMSFVRAVNAAYILGCHAEDLNEWEISPSSDGTEG